MALIKCKECGREISDQAPACPGCGAPMNVAMGIPAAWTAPATPAPTPTPPPHPTPSPPTPAAPPKKNGGCLRVLVLAFLGFVLLGAFVNSCTQRSLQSTTDPAASRSPSPVAPPAVDPEAAAKQRAMLAEQMEDPANSLATRIARARALASDHAGTPEAERASTLLPELDAALAKENLGRHWIYNAADDGMSSKQSYQASVLSENTFQFDFPYQGPQKARLTLRKHPRWGNDIYLTIERGQILCSSYSCPVRIRFDDGQARTFTGNEPESNSSETVFIPGYNGLEASIRKAKRMRVEVNIHDYGALQLEFNVEGFDPTKHQPK